LVYLMFSRLLLGRLRGGLFVRPGTLLRWRHPAHADVLASPHG
jgi:hypothetical protein